MHELAVCQALIRQVSQIAAEKGATAVNSIELSIGGLSGVEPPLLASAFTVARQGTVASSAELRIETGPVVVECRSCGAQSEVQANRLLCGQCGDWKVTVREGEDLMLVRIDLALPPDGFAEREPASSSDNHIGENHYV
jgi:hydrogenase nickel incorporation protein HypA/HybF